MGRLTASLLPDLTTIHSFQTVWGSGVRKLDLGRLEPERHKHHTGLILFWGEALGPVCAPVGGKERERAEAEAEGLQLLIISQPGLP